LVVGVFLFAGGVACSLFQQWRSCRRAKSTKQGTLASPTPPVKTKATHHKEGRSGLRQRRRSSKTEQKLQQSPDDAKKRANRVRQLPPCRIDGGFSFFVAWLVYTTVFHYLVRDTGNDLTMGKGCVTVWISCNRPTYQLKQITWPVVFSRDSGCSRTCYWPP